jgi:hypothetical protein
MMPLQSWDETDACKHPMHVWGAHLDNRYLVEVQRKDRDTAIVCIFDHQDNDKLIYSNDTTLAYGAAYGPDSEDVARWEEECVEFVDSLK